MPFLGGVEPRINFLGSLSALLFVLSSLRLPLRLQFRDRGPNGLEFVLDLFVFFTPLLVEIFERSIQRCLHRRLPL